MQITRRQIKDLAIDDSKIEDASISQGKITGDWLWDFNSLRISAGHVLVGDFDGVSTGASHEIPLGEDFVEEDRGGGVKLYVIMPGVFADTVDGLVPGPAAAGADAGNFLRGDGTWQDITIAVFGVDTNGLVPGPDTPTAAGNFFLKADGTWVDITIPIFGELIDGLVPQTGDAGVDADKFLRGDGVWATPGGVQVYGELASGTIDGDNDDFTIANASDDTQVRVFLNGVRLQLTEDYTFTAPSALHMVVPPEVGDVILVDYTIVA